MELTLLEETSITLTELDSMNEERKWMYYYYIIAKKKREVKEMEAQRVESKGKTVSMQFPSDFVSIVNNKLETGDIGRPEPERGIK